MVTTTAPPMQPQTSVRSILNVSKQGVDQSFLLSQNWNDVGRSIQSTIRLNHPEVSRQQAVLLRDPVTGRFKLLDGDGRGKPSSNGTFVNGARIDECLLQSGAIIHFGGNNVTARFYQLNVRENATPLPMEIPDIEESIPDTSTELVFPG